MIDTFSASFRDLSASWRIFYENFGRNQSRAITEEVTRCEPLGRKVIKELLPQLQQHETDSGLCRQRHFDEVAHDGSHHGFIFALSVVLSATLALLESRRLTQGLKALKTGADLLGAGNLAHRIPADSKDELGDLARTFNGMAGRLHSARDELQVLMDREHLKP